MTDRFQEIKSICNLIARKINSQQDYFLLDEHCQMMLIDLAKIEVKPHSFVSHSYRERNILMIDLSVKKPVKIFSYDVDDPVTETWKNTYESIRPWNDVEDTILTFLKSHCKELSSLENAEQELNKILDKHSSNIITGNSGDAVGTRVSRAIDPIYSDSGRVYRESNFNSPPKRYDTGISSNSHYYEDYCEREDFLEEIYKLMKAGNTSKAIDQVDLKIKSFIAAEKYSTVTSILRLCDFNKLNTFILLALFKSAHEVNEKIDSLNDFKSKVKAHLTKLSPRRATKILEKAEIIEKTVKNLNVN